MKEDDVYAAGLIDGEGSIMLLSSHRSKFKVPTISMTSTSYELIDFMQKTYGGVVCKHKTYKDHHKKSWSWRIRYNKVFNFISKILPYLKDGQKVRRARFLQAFYKKYTPRNGRYSEECLKKKKQLERVFFHL